MGAAANLILGSDLTAPGDLGMNLLTDPEIPMQPRNPGSGTHNSWKLGTSGPAPDIMSCVYPRQVRTRLGPVGKLTVRNAGRHCIVC
jgi:hypothetical protein